MAYINLLEIIYPVGSVYISTNATSPAEIIGGSWTKIEGAALRSCSETDEIGYVGSDTHTLTVAEMPSHIHTTRTNWILYDKGGWGTSGVTGTVPQPAAGANTPYNFGAINSFFTSQGSSQAHSIVQRSYNVHIYYRIS